MVLLRNVALSVFQGKVHGQSLNARISRNETTVEILDGSIDGNGVGIQRTADVTRWVLNFVGPRERIAKGQTNLIKEELPPDTLVE